jgi:hypothetical protein
MAAKTITAQFENLPKILKFILFLLLGGLLSGIFRVLRFLETKNLVTLVFGIVCFFGVGFVVGIIDAVTELLGNKVSVLAD